MSILSSVPTRIKLGGGFGVAVIALLVAGVPFSALVPLAGPAACLGMMLFMSHGHGHSEHHSEMPSPGTRTDR